MREVASALSTHTTAARAFFRDIKPDTSCSPRQLDGDRLRRREGNRASTVHHGDGTITSRGIALGTPAYMAPEQAAADPAMDHRDRPVAFGALLAYERSLARHPSLVAPRRRCSPLHVAEAPEPITRRRPGLPPVLASLVMRCLEKRAADRPQTAADVVQLLDSINTPSGGTTPAATTAWSGGRWPRVTAIVLAGLILAVLGVAAGRAFVASRDTEASANRVFVSRFANNTGAPTVDQVGPMAADWVTRGLAETGMFEVVQDSAGRAGTVVRGAIYRRGGQPQLLARSPTRAPSCTAEPGSDLDSARRSARRREVLRGRIAAASRR